MVALLSVALLAVTSVPTNVPPLLVTTSGEAVPTKAAWESVRAPEIRAFYLSQVYGRRPKAAERPRVSFSSAAPDVEAMGGLAIRKMMRCTVEGPRGSFSFPFQAFIPKQAKPAPAFLLICNRDPLKNLDPTRTIKSGFWPAERIVARGYAALAFFNGDVARDRDNGFDNGVFSIYEAPGGRTDESWGILSAWAWGASRVMDWVEREPLLDARHVAVVGHSRGGKAALVAGVTDARFALTCSNDSGCGGAKLNHIDLPASEHFAQIGKSVGCWFARNFRALWGRERELPFDQHMWAALVAPRLLAIASAREDAWAGPEGEAATAAFASPAWELYGRTGLGDSVFYYVRPGEHDLTEYDWDRYLDFADRHGWRAK